MHEYLSYSQVLSQVKLPHSFNEESGKVETGELSNVTTGFLPLTFVRPMFAISSQT